MVDFVKSKGLPFLANVLVRLKDHFIRGCDEWYPEAGMVSPARARSTLLALSECGRLSVTELAAIVGASHPLMNAWVSELRDLGLVRTRPDPADGRRSLVSLTAKGRAENEKNVFYSQNVVKKAYERLIAEADAEGVLDALWRMEEACQRKPFSDRLREARAELEASKRAPARSRQKKAG